MDSAALYEAWEKGKAGLRVVDGQGVNVEQRLICKEMEREDPVGRIAELPATVPVGHVNGDCGFDYCDGGCAEIEEDGDRVGGFVNHLPYGADEFRHFSTVERRYLQ